MDTCPETYWHVYIDYTPKRVRTGTLIHVQSRTGTCAEPVQARVFTSRGVRIRAQSLHTEKSRYRHGDTRPKAYLHVHKAYTPKRAGTGTEIHVQRRTCTCTKPTHRKEPVQARGSTSRGLKAREQGLHKEKAATGTWILVQRPKGT